MSCLKLKGLNIESKWGREGIDIANGKQLYPYNSEQQCEDCLELYNIEKKTTDDMDFEDLARWRYLKRNCNC